VTNPYREAAPWARAITLVILGAVILYGLGRWDAGLDRKLAELKAETAAVIQVIQISRAWADSVRALEDSLERTDAALAIQGRRTRVALQELAAQDSAVVVRAETAELDSLLPLVRMRPLQFADTTWYATDSAQVRVLARGVLRLPVLEAQADTLRSLVNTQATRIATLSAGWAAARSRADTLQAQVNLAEPLLQRWQKHSSCKILGLIKCPSRTTAFIVGTVAGAVTVAIIRRE